MKNIVCAIISGFLFLLNSAAAWAGDPAAADAPAFSETVPGGAGSGLRDGGASLIMAEGSDETNIKMKEEGEASRHDAGTEKETKPRRKQCALIDPSRSEYIALFAGYGGYFPVAEYGKGYRPGHQVSFCAGVYYINFLGLSPELHVQYGVMDYKEDLFHSRASLSQVRFYPAIIYRYPFKLPRNSLTVYGRIWDGLSMINYKTRDPYVPVMARSITEYLNVFGLSAGCYYDVWKGFLVGVDVSYSIVSTARKPLQAVSLSVNIGWRIL